MSPVKVVYVASWSRSGSTLLDLLLGQVPGLFSGGELRYFWQRGAVEDQLCGCQRPFGSCPFWSGVVDRGFGGRSGLELGRVLPALERMDRLHHVPRLAASGPGAWPAFATLKPQLERLYRATLEASGGRAVVDSSKYASYALIVSGVPGLELHVVHLVRDARAVAHSWQRIKPLPEVHWRPAFMDVKGPLRSSLFWSLENLAIETLRRRARTYVRVRYEDLVASPREHLGRILKSAGEPDDALGFLVGDGVEFGDNHTVAGNPARFRRGRVQLRADAEWRAAMPASRRLVVTAMTWPLLRRYRAARAGMP